MFDSEHKVTRYVAEYSATSEELTAEYELSAFDLIEFQREFNAPNADDPMYDCYEIKAEHTAFLKAYLNKPPIWDFDASCYFVESHL